MSVYDKSSPDPFSFSRSTRLGNPDKVGDEEDDDAFSVYAKIKQMELRKPQKINLMSITRNNIMELGAQRNLKKS